jgi:hypothetical protein
LAIGKAQIEQLSSVNDRRASKSQPRARPAIVPGQLTQLHQRLVHDITQDERTVT